MDVCNVYMLIYLVILRKLKNIFVELNKKLFKRSYESSPLTIPSNPGQAFLRSKND